MLGRQLLVAAVVLALQATSAGRLKAAHATPEEMTAAIDQHFAKHWSRDDVKPEPPTNDADFLRRATLDLIGRIPTHAEARQFLASRDAEKRRIAIERLLGQPAHARHFGTVWRQIWLPQTETPPHDYLRDELDQWLTRQFQARTSYDLIVRRLLSVPAPSTASASEKGRDAPRTPVAFLLANDMRPEELAANTTRELLGVNLECAECHDHPFAQWKQEQFWQTAAFFARGASSESMPEITIPDSNKTVAAKVWTGETLAAHSDGDKTSPREAFADWVTSPQNSFFARNAVNRLWAYLLGAPLCEPIDDLTSASQSPHAQLLEDLSEAFVGCGFDVDSLTRAIVESRVYQLSVRRGDEPRQPDDFAAAVVRSFSGEQLYDSLQVATGRSLAQADLDAAEHLLERRRFIDAFQVMRAEKPRRSVVQALALMNGAVINALVAPDNCPIVAVAAEGPFSDASEQIQYLYLSVLSRYPSHEEAEPLEQLVANCNDIDHQKVVLSDIVWAMLNSVEFSTIH